MLPPSREAAGDGQPVFSSPPPDIAEVESGQEMEGFDHSRHTDLQPNELGSCLLARCFE